MLLRGATPASCFGLGGSDENAGTSAIGWCIEQSPALRRELLTALNVEPALELAVRSQVYAQDRGFTDLELVGGTTMHAIFEAKIGWQVPTTAQLERYVPRLLESSARERLLVSVSAADSAWAKRHLPPTIAGIQVLHLSWSDISASARKALGKTRSPIERVWLEQLNAHLKGYGMTSNIFDSRAYVVSLNRDPIKTGNPYTWIDVVTKDGKYFHPVGTNGWPVIPPAYIGFRHMAQFRSVHFIESARTVDNLAAVDPNWPETNSPHFIYTLGPPMAPAKPMPIGKIHPNMRNWMAIDILLSGCATDYKDALGLMRQRNEAIQR